MTIRNTTSSGSAAPLHQFSFVALAAAYPSLWKTQYGSYTTGQLFSLLCGAGAVNVCGVRGFAKFGAYPRTLKCSLWAGTTRLALTTVQVTADGVWEARFPSPVRISHDYGEGQKLCASVFDTESAPQWVACDFPFGGNSFAFPQPPWADGAVVLHALNFYAAGDAAPAGNSTYVQVPVEPILERAQ